MIKATVKEQLYKDRSCRNIILVNNNGDELMLHPDVSRQLAELVYGFRTIKIGQIVKYENLGHGFIRLRLDEK